ARDDTRSPKARVDALLLDDPDGSKATALEHFLRETSNKSPLEAVSLLAQSEHDLWLGRLKPQYAGDELKAIRLLSWRGRGGDVLRWSGLREESDGQLRFIIDRNTSARMGSKLEVRWNTEPDGLRDGAVEYRIAILSDADEELAARTVTHKQ